MHEEESFTALLTSAPHWLFELTTDIVFGVLAALIFVPLWNKLLNRVHKQMDEKHGVTHHDGHIDIGNEHYGLNLKGENPGGVGTPDPEPEPTPAPVEHNDITLRVGQDGFMVLPEKLSDRTLYFLLQTDGLVTDTEIRDMLKAEFDKRGLKRPYGAYFSLDEVPDSLTWIGGGSAGFAPDADDDKGFVPVGAKYDPNNQRTDEQKARDARAAVQVAEESASGALRASGKTTSERFRELAAEPKDGDEGTAGQPAQI
jgi:hypothetical protein